MQQPCICYQARGAGRQLLSVATARAAASKRPAGLRSTGECDGARARTRARAKGDAAHGVLAQCSAKSYAFLADPVALAAPVGCAGLSCCGPALSTLLRFLESAAVMPRTAAPALALRGASALRTDEEAGSVGSPEERRTALLSAVKSRRPRVRTNRDKPDRLGNAMQGPSAAGRRAALRTFCNHEPKAPEQTPFSAS